MLTHFVSLPFNKRFRLLRLAAIITSLPFAARADWQWQIAKETRDGETLSLVTPLDAAGRVEEIARMLGDRGGDRFRAVADVPDGMG